jgi:hypothetical protein
MPNTMLTYLAGRWPRRFFASAVLLGAMTMSSVASAATARVRWLPSPASGVTGYKVYVRNAGSTYGSAQWTGNPAPESDGALSALVTYSSATSGVNYFTVVATGGTLESGLSQELPVGEPNPCENDSCSTKTSCNFSLRPDGSPCDDASFCNGAETCRSGVCDQQIARDCADAIACTVDSCDDAAGQCTHVGPPGCCVACDVDDPCLAAACAQGDCSAEAGIELEVNRVRLVKKAAGITLAAKGRFVTDGAIDPAATGAEIELRAIDGTLVFRSIILPSRIRSRTSGRYRFQSTRAESAELENGITRLDFRGKGDRWTVTLKGETPALEAASVEPTLTWLIRLGDTCTRQIDMACDQSNDKAVCR